MGSLVSSASGVVSSVAPIVTTGLGVYADVQEHESQQEALAAQAQYNQQQADLAYQQALQEQQWEQQRLLQEQQYREQELAYQQLRQQQEYEFALQQQEWEREQRAYEQQLRDWEYNRLLLEQQSQLDATIAQQDQQYAQAQQSFQLQSTELQQNQELADQNRRDDLRRAVAKQRVSFGARGVETTGGSGQVVLRGLIEDSEQEGEQRRLTDSFRQEALTQELGNLYQRNLLERTQLAEAQRFQLLSHLS